MIEICAGGTGLKSTVLNLGATVIGGSPHDAQLSPVLKGGVRPAPWPLPRCLGVLNDSPRLEHHNKNPSSCLGFPACRPLVLHHTAVAQADKNVTHTLRTLLGSCRSCRRLPLQHWVRCTPPTRGLLRILKGRAQHFHEHVAIHHAFEVSTVGMSRQDVSKWLRLDLYRRCMPQKHSVGLWHHSNRCFSA